MPTFTIKTLHWLAVVLAQTLALPLASWDRGSCRDLEEHHVSMSSRLTQWHHCDLTSTKNLTSDFL